MNLHILTDYATARRDQLTAFENVVPHAYADSRGIPTIGIGVNLRDHLNLVLQALGFDLFGSVLSGAARVAELGYIQQLTLAIDNNFQPYPVTTKDPQTQLPVFNNAVRNALQPILALRAVDGSYSNYQNFPRVTEFQLATGVADSLLVSVLDGYDLNGDGIKEFGGVETLLDNLLNTPVGGLPSPASVNPGLVRQSANNQNSSERLALLSLYYNLPKLIGSGLLTALANDDRAEAWFEIRYRSNAYKDAKGNVIPDRSGIAKRRYGEADLFGLLPVNPIEDDYIAVFRMYARHKNDTLHGGQAAGLTGYELLFPPPSQQTLPAEFQLSASQLGALYKPGISWDKILVDPSGSTNATQVTVTGGADGELIFGEGGSERLIGGGGDDALVGGQGNDTLEGGAGNDTYFFKPGDGVDEIVDSDGQGSIHVGSITLDGAGAHRAGGSMMFEKWAGPLAGQTITYTLVHKGVDGQGNPLTDLWIEGGGLASGDRIIVKDYSPTRNFGITLDQSAKLALVPGTMVVDVWTPGYTPTTASATLQENGALSFGLAANRPVQAGDHVDFSITGNGGDHAAIQTGAETLSFVNGHLQVTLAPGQDLANLALLSRGDFDTDEQTTLTATLRDAQGNVIGASATMNVLFSAVVEPADPSGTTPINGTSASEQILGTSSNDLILAGAGDDVVGGFEGEDWIDGGTGRDLLDGWAGNDLVVGGAEGDVLQGGDGNDRLFADSVVDVQQAIANGDTDNNVALQGDVLNGQGGDDTLIGTSRIDVLAGGDGQDVLIAGAGDDLIVGDGHFQFPIYGLPQEVAEAWNWTIVHQVTGGSHQFAVSGFTPSTVTGAADSIYAGAGNDGVVAGGGADFVDAGPGDDVVLGQDGNDTLLGGTGNDYLRGGSSGDAEANDFLDGGAGNDTLYGADGDDVLYGGSGDDTLYADDNTALDGADYLNGEDGNDTLIGGGRADTLIGGAGSDTLRGDGPSVLPNLNGDDYLDGGTGDDTLYGDGGADTLIGGTGIDLLLGDVTTESVLYGNDYLSGGDGNDVLLGAGGNDTLDGGEGDDQLYGDAADTPIAVQGADQIDGGAGNDTVFAGGGDDTATGGDGNDLMYGEAGNDYLRGDAGDDYLSGDDGADTLVGGDGTDTLYGGDGNDALSGGLGADYLNGGAGDDVYYFSAADLAPVNNVVDTIVDTSGHDVVVFDSSMALSGLLLGSPAGSGNLQIANSSQTAVLSVSGLLSGSSSVREFRFADGQVISANRLVGDYYTAILSTTSTDPNAYVVGGTQADTLVAFGQDATLSGGQGDDVLYGGNESTTYLFTRGDGSDTIYDTGSQSAPQNTLALGNVYSPELSLRYRPGVGAQLVVSDGGGSLTLGTFNGADVLGTRTIDTLQFVDGGETKTWSEFVTEAGVDIVGDAGTSPLINGTSVTDRIVGWSSDETINAGAGDDTIDGGAGNDTMDGGAGSDMYLFGAGSGQDVINNADTATGKVDTLVIDGSLTRAQLTFLRYENSLVVRATGTSDRVFVTNYFNGVGLDEIRLGDGTVYTPANVVLDLITNQITTGDDEIFGTAGNDTLDALAGNDAVFGGSGNDTIAGNDGDDVLRGELGNDVLDGGRGFDTLYGGDGNDTLTGGAVETDTLYGEAGDDILTGAGTLDGGDGNDVLTSTYASVLDGGTGNDLLTGSTYGGETLRGGTGDDVLNAGGATTFGSDTLDGGAGNDTYIVNRGDSVSIFQNDTSAGRLDTLRFGPGILPSQLHFRGDIFGNLTITVDQNGSQPGLSVSLGGYLADDALTNKVDRVIFDADPGTVWTSAQLEALAMVPSDADQYMRGTAGNDVLNGLGGWDYLHGRDGNDQLLGGDSPDQLYGEAGDDVLNGGASSDSLDGGSGSDTYVYNLGDGNDTISGLADPVQGTTDTLRFGPGIRPENVMVRGGGSNDIFFTVFDPITAAQSGTITVTNGFSSFGADILDQVQFTDVPGTVWSRTDLQLLTLSGSNASETLMGFSTDDLIRGNGGDDRIDGGAGNDDLAGGTGNDSLIGGAGDDVFRFGHGQGFDEIADTSGVNRIVLDAGIAPADVVLYRTSSGTVLNPGFLPTKTSDGLALVLNGTGEQLWIRNFFNGQSPRAINEIDFADGTVWNAAAIDAHTVNQGGTASSFTGTTGNDNYTVDHPSDTITEATGGGTDGVTSSVTYTLPANVENLTLSGVLNINATGNTPTNTLTGNSGDNYLNGGGSVASPDGVDTLIGGAGNDTYEVYKDPNFGANNFNDIVTEAANQGYDTLIANSHSATLPSNVEALTVKQFSGTYTATTQIYQGNALDNVIDARGATTTGYGFLIDGGAGADLMIGPSFLSFSATVDRVIRYIVDNAGDVVIGSPGATSVVYDLVQSSVSYVMPDSVERLELTGSAPIAGTGNALANYLNGATSSGANVLSGGLGNDQYTLGAGDTLSESAGGGTDTVVLTVSAGPIYDLAVYANVENLTVLDSVGSGQLIGTAADNVIVGNASTNLLTGGGGNDQLMGGAGDDWYMGFGVGSGVDVIVDSAGTDTIAFDGAQNITISQVQFAHVGNDLRISLGGPDSVTVQSWFSSATNAVEWLGLYDNDLYYRYTKAQIDARLAGTNSAPVVNNAGFIPQAMATEALSFVVPANAFTDIESQQSLTYTLTRADGSALPAWLSFDPVTRTLSGTPGTGDIGTLSLRITATDPGALSANLAFDVDIAPVTIYGTSGADNITGDAGDNLVFADAGNDTVHGLAGNDELYGEADDDMIFGDAGNDYLDGDIGNDQLYGGADNDYLFGSYGNDVLDGGTGDDELDGFLGDDTYVVDSVNDVIYESPGEGTDTVQSSITYTLGADLENLTLIGTSAINGTGNTLDNVITGNSAANNLSGGAGNDTLNGGAGNDTMSGGLGNDSFYVDAADTVIESSGQGTDTVYSSAASYTLANNVENLVLLGTGNLNGTGNTAANVITGNSGNNTLSGGTGADTMSGAAGNDIYVVDNTADVVSENASEGTDLVQSAVTYTITDTDIENLTLTGTTAINGTGNASDNVLIGNSGNNTLTGAAGNDTLDGGAGTDTMLGGQGNDTYVVAQTTDVVTENAAEGTDLVQSSVTYTITDVDVENLTLTGTTAINGTGNASNNVLIGNSANNTLTGAAGNDTLNGGAGTDTMVGGAGDDVYYVDVAGDVTTESAGQGIDTVNSSITRTLGSNIELLFLTGSSAINGTGLSTANLLRGNSAINTLMGAGGTDILEGGLGNDILSNTSGNTLLNGGGDNDTLTGTANNDLLIGGLGNDTITTGQGADIIVFNQGEGQDTVAASTTKDNTLALGGGFLYSDLLFQKSGNNLILKAGATDQITFTNYYASSSNRSVDKLQIVIEGTSDYVSGSSDPLHNKKITTFNFDGLVAAFDAALVANPGLTSWALTNAMVMQYLSGSDTAAIGGDLAYRYGRFDTLSDISFTPALALLAAAGFGSSTQALQSLASLQDTSPRLG